MTKIIARIILNLLSSAIGLFVASLLLDGLTITILGFGLSVAFFTIANFLFEPLITQLSNKYLPALRGGIALVTTFIGLLLTRVFTNGLSIEGLSTWIFAPLIVWLSVLVAGIILPMFIFKETLSKNKR